MKNKKYIIDSFEKLLNVINDENFVVLSTDLINWMSMYVSVVKSLREAHPKETAGKTNWEICQPAFEWTDDGKNEFKGIELHDTKTGKVTFIKHEKNTKKKS